jgi:hypothetical protein
MLSCEVVDGRKDYPEREGREKVRSSKREFSREDEGKVSGRGIRVIEEASISFLVTQFPTRGISIKHWQMNIVQVMLRWR